MADNKVHDASWDVVNSVRETNQALANSVVTTLDNNMKFAHSIFLNGLEVLENQTENTRNFTQEWSQQVQRQQEAYQKLASATLNIYMDFLRIPFTFYQQLVDTTGDVARRQLDYTQNAVREAIDTASSAARRTTETTSTAVQHGLDQAQKATRQAHQGSQKQGE
jgi:hypothetical protein